MLQVVHVSQITFLAWAVGHDKLSRCANDLENLFLPRLSSRFSACDQDRVPLTWTPAWTFVQTSWRPDHVSWDLSVGTQITRSNAK